MTLIGHVASKLEDLQQGGCIIIGSHIVKGWSKTQFLIALSSAESDLFAAIHASAETLGVMPMMLDMVTHYRAKCGVMQAQRLASLIATAC